MNPEIYTGEYEVISSGVFHAIEDEKTPITIGGLTITLLFERTDDGEQKIKYNGIDEQTAELTVINTEGSIGYGTTKPYLIGKMNGKEIYLNFVTRSLADTHMRSFEYTFYKKR